MRNKNLRKVLATALVAGAVCVANPGTALAVSPATFNPETDRPPANETPKPPSEMRQASQCATSAVLPGSQFHSIPINQVFQVDQLHRFANGAGQTVAVIDSGVTPNARLPHLRGAGDYITGGDGLEDCDHHGTLISGIIGAQPAKNDAFIGVAPEANLVSIRQTSGAYTPVNPEDKGASSLDTLAKAIRRAADEGATVINMSVTSCVPATANVNLSELKGALHYAAVEKDIVVVASAGNVDDSCEANPGPSADNPDDKRGWDRVGTLSLPSYIDDFVLSVGGTTLTGDPYARSMPGPWVDVAAPAISVVSLDPVAGDVGGLINAEVTQQGTTPISGTSFASAYVSGLAALIRQVHPDLTAQQVRERIINSSHPQADTMNNVLGRGIVDPVNALTGDIPLGEWAPQVIPDRGGRVPVDPDTSPSATVIVAGSLIVAILAAVGCVVMRNWIEGQKKKGRTER